MKSSRLVLWDMGQPCKDILTWTLSSTHRVSNYFVSGDVISVPAGVEGSQILQEGFDPLLDMLIKYLERRLPGQLFDKHRTVHSVQFKFENRIDVDMLVSPFWREPSAFYHFLGTISPKDRFT